MLRQLHSLPGLIAALLVMILAMSGAMLSVDPALERLHQAPVASRPTQRRPTGGTRCQPLLRRGADSAQRVRDRDRLLQPERSGRCRNGRSLTGQGLAPYQPSAFSRWMKDLHRSLFLGTPGHGVAGAAHCSC
jgi:sulfite reductase (NADPH) flavoprotein alpha-component